MPPCLQYSQYCRHACPADAPSLTQCAQSMNYLSKPMPTCSAGTYQHSAPKASTIGNRIHPLNSIFFPERRNPAGLGDPTLRKGLNLWHLPRREGYVRLRCVAQVGKIRPFRHQTAVRLRYNANRGDTRSVSLSKRWPQARSAAANAIRAAAVRFPVYSTAPPAGTDGALMYSRQKEGYFLRRRTQRPASASREREPVVGSGICIR